MSEPEDVSTITSDFKPMTNWAIDLIPADSPFVLPDEERARWTATMSLKERYSILKDVSCQPRASDDSSTTALRIKWASMFDENIPVESIRKQMDVDIEKRDQRKRELHTKLDSLMLARSAHGKKQRKKAEKEAQRIAKLEKDLATFKEKYADLRATCSNKFCFQAVLPKDGIVYECKTCWGAEKQGLPRKGDGFFCSEKCMTDGLMNHVNEKHPCGAKAHCTAQGDRCFPDRAYGFCKICWSTFGAVTYWCDKGCQEADPDHGDAYHDKLFQRLWEDDDRYIRFYEQGGWTTDAFTKHPNLAQDYERRIRERELRNGLAY